MKLLSYLVFIPLQIVMIPFAIVGTVLTGYRQILVSKRLGVSQTAIEIINGRWTMHIFGLRRDDETAALMEVLPNTSTVGLWLVLFPLWVQSKIAGECVLYPRVPKPGDETIADLVPARTQYFDAVLSRRLADAEQFVLLGAGYDTRGMGESSQGGTVFEVDQAIVQRHKRAQLAAAKVDASRVTFVEVDFNADNLFDALQSAGFNPSLKTVFLWEGVTLYLSSEQVSATLALIKENSAPGSSVVADFYGERLIKTLGKSKATEGILEMTGESLHFGLPFAADWEAVLSDYVAKQSINLASAHFLGENNAAGPYAVVAELTF
jgi:methyltransferase (TIGR00027 family)